MKTPFVFFSVATAFSVLATSLVWADESLSTATLSASGLTEATTYTSSSGYSGTESGSNQGTISLTIVVDADSLDSSSSGYSLVTASGASTATWNSGTAITLGIGYSSTYGVSGWWSSSIYTGSDSTGTIYSTDELSGSVVITLTSGSSGSVLYVDGVAVGSCSGLKYSSASLTTITTSDAVTAVYAWDSTLTASEVSSIYTELTESSSGSTETATLSLTSSSTSVTAEDSISSGRTYSGFIMSVTEVDSSNSNKLAYSTFTEWKGDGTVGESYIGTETYVDSANNGNAVLWHYFSNQTDSVYGNTLRVDLSNFGEDTTIYDDFSSLYLGGLIVERSEYSLTIGNSRATSRKYYFQGNGDVNLTIGADTTLTDTLSGAAVYFESGGKWEIATGKTLKFDVGTTYLEGVDVAVTNLDGSGTATVAFGGELELLYGSSMSIGGGVLLDLDAASTETSVATNLYGIYASYSELANAGTIDISTTSAGGIIYGIAATGSSTVSNTGAITISNTSTGSNSADTAYGVYLEMSSMTNSGTIDITETVATGAASGVRVAYVSSTTADMTNNGQLDIEVTASGTTSSAYSRGIVLDTYTTFANEAGGEITITSASGKYASGIQLSSYARFTNGGTITATVNGVDTYALNIPATLTNTGSITVSTTASSSAYGLYNSSGGEVANSGTMDITSTSTGGVARGVYFGKGTFDNSGSLSVSVTSGSTEADGIRLYNSGSVMTNTGAITVEATAASGSAYGLYVYNQSALVNDGVLTVNASGSTAYGAYIASKSARLVNTGTLTLNTSGTTTDATVYGIYLKTSTAYFANSGTVKADSIYSATSTNKIYLADGTQIGAASEGGTTTVSGNGSIVLGGKMTVSGSSVSIAGQSSGSTIKATSNLVISGASISTLDGVTLTTASEGGDDLSITLEDVTMSLLDDQTYSFENTLLTGSTTVAATTGASLTLDNVTIVLTADNSSYTISSSEDSTVAAEALEEAAVAIVSATAVADSLAADATLNTITFTSSMLDNVEVSGNYTIDLSSYVSSSGIDLSDYDAIYVNFGEGTTFSDDVSISAITDAEGTTTELYVLASANTVVFRDASEFATVPEPATSTLSLVALAGLALRRRRR